MVLSIPHSSAAKLLVKAEMSSDRKLQVRLGLTEGKSFQVFGKNFLQLEIYLNTLMDKMCTMAVPGHLSSRIFKSSTDF
jgi:hypothetical protein